MTESIYNVAYEIWNTLISIAMSLMTTSPKEASHGELYTTTKNLFNAIKDIALPIAIIFFLIAIYRDVVGTPPEQQARRFLGDALKFCVMVAVLVNLWDIMGYVIQISDGVTDKLAGVSDYEKLKVSDDLKAVIKEAAKKPEVNISFATFGEDLGMLLAAWVDHLMTSFLFFITSLVTLIIIISSALSIISSAFQRIIKPLAILPFAAITVAMAAGSGDASRVASNYVKTFFGFCISGAFMVICIKLGGTLSKEMINIETMAMFTTGTLHEKVLLISIQNAVTPIVIAGLVKTADHVISRFF